VPPTRAPRGLLRREAPNLDRLCLFRAIRIFLPSSMAPSSLAQDWDPSWLNSTWT
jgi:hypothetical protein